MHRRFYPISIILAVVIFLLGQASAAPTSWSSTETFFHRQANGNPPSQPFTTQTVQTTQTAAGPVTETCTFTFTPVTGANGESLVQVVRACSVAAGAPPPPPNAPGSATSPPPQAFTSTSTSIPPPQTPPPAPPPPATSPVVSTPDSSTPTPSTSAPSSIPTPLNPVFSSVPLSMIPAPSSPPSSQTPTSSAGPSSSPDPASGQSGSSSPTNTGTVSPDTAADTTPTPDATATPQGAFQIPGKKISVLPIGLGIFAGISVIALIVVGLVTYERTKYRKIFRQRKLAELGSAPGYGGMDS